MLDVEVLGWCGYMWSPCYTPVPEQTNQTLALDGAGHVFASATLVRIPLGKGNVRRVGCNLQCYCYMPLNLTH